MKEVFRKVALAATLEGYQGLAYRVTKRVAWQRPWQTYARWIERYELPERRALARMPIESMVPPPLPRISILMPTFNSRERWLRGAIDSVRAQVYPEWELCIADDCSSASHVRGILERYAELDPRIRVAFRSGHGHISASTNTALELATGEYVAPMDHDDLLPEHALFLVAKYIRAFPDADLLYSDEDKIDERARRFEPYFKSAFNAELLLAQNCISHLGIYRRRLVEAVGGFRIGFEGSQDWDLALRIIDRTVPKRIVHIPHVLYHWRAVRARPQQISLASPMRTELRGVR